MHRAVESAGALGRLRDALVERTQGLLNTEGGPSEDGMSHSQYAPMPCYCACLCAGCKQPCLVSWAAGQAYSRGSLLRLACRLCQLLGAQQRALRELSAFASAATELTPPSSTLNHPSMASALSAANSALLDAHKSLSQALEKLDAAAMRAPTLDTSAALPESGAPAPAVRGGPNSAWRPPLLFTNELLAAMRAAADAIATVEADVAACGRVAVTGLDVPELAGDPTVARLHPALPRFQAALSSAEQACVAPLAAQLAAPAAQSALADVGSATAAQSAQPGAGDSVAALAAAVEATLQQALVWAQGPFDVAPSGGTAAFAAALQRVSGVLSARAVPALVSALTQCACALQQPLPARLPQPLLQQLSRVLSMVDTVRAGLWAALMSAVTLHSAGTRLTVLSAATFVAYMKDGFGRGEADEEEGETEGGADGEGALVYIFAWMCPPCLRARAHFACA